MNSFLNRRDAGMKLAALLSEYENRPDVIVLGIPRGGVVVAHAIATTLRLPLDIVLIRKVFQPGRDAVQVGTIASGGFELLDDQAIEATHVDRRIAERELSRARQDLAFQERVYRGARPFPDVRGRTAIIVADGMVSGGTMTTAVNVVRARGAAAVIVATPVAEPNACAAIERVADRCICIEMPSRIYRIGIWYDDFPPVSDATVLALLDMANRGQNGVAA
jgi:putative phosphoribosyl transferase